MSSVGRAMEADEWERDEMLGGATSVAIFKRLENEIRVQKAREILNKLQLPGTPHELLAEHQHLAHPSAQKPKSVKEIADIVKGKMEEFREAFMMVEELWFERDIAIACGGWIELLIKAIEESEFLVLKKDGEGTKNARGMWVVEIVGGVTNPRQLWPTEGDRSLDHIPANWIPGEGETESSESEWVESTDMDGDVSWDGSEDEEDIERPKSSGWGPSGWGKLDEGELAWTDHGGSGREGNRTPHSSGNSTTGWDGDESDDTT